MLLIMTSISEYNPTLPHAAAMSLSDRRAAGTWRRDYCPDRSQHRCVDLEPLSARSAETALHTSRSTTPKPERHRRASRLPAGYYSVTGAALLAGRAASAMYE